MEQHAHRRSAHTAHGWRRFFTFVLALALALASVPIAPAIVQATPSTTLVISQFQTYGGTKADEFVELHNVGPNPVDLNSYRLVWRGMYDATDTTLVSWTTSTVVQAGQYYLIAAMPGYRGSISADISYGPDLLDELRGGLAPRKGAENTGTIVDSVGYGSVPSDFPFIEGTKTAVPVQGGSRVRKAATTNGGCQDTDNNNDDFGPLTTSKPRNTTSAFLYCVPSNPQGVGAAAPDPASAGSRALLTVAVTPGNAQPSTGLTVTADLTALGGSATQAFFDDGTNGDAAAGDNTFSFLAAIAPAAPGGALSIPATIRDDQARSVTVTITVNVTARTFIHQIQGVAQVSPKNQQNVTNVQGVVTALRSNGFYLQGSDELAYGDLDNDPATSEGIFVYTGGAPTVAAGNRVSVGGTVQEYYGVASAAPTNLPVTEIAASTVTLLAASVPLPAPVIVGAGGRVPPATVIEDDVTGGNAETGNTFDPENDGLDFWESLEGMLVQINNPLAVGPTRNFGSNREIPIVGDNGAHATTLTPRGGLIVQANDFNPERIILNDLIAGGPKLPQVNTGATLPGPIIGVLDYTFGNFKLQVTSPAPFGTPTGGATRATTAVTAGTNQLTIATFNVQNLSPRDPQAKFDTLAGYIKTNLGAPDILALEEVQDNSGGCASATNQTPAGCNDGTVDATTTVNLLLAAIASNGGPTYQAAWINPQDNQDGGQPYGNIRVVFLYRTDRGVAFVNRPYDSATCPTNNPATCPVSVTGSGSTAHLIFSPGRIDPQNTAFADSRKPLAGEFTFNGHTIFVIGNHFKSKSGDQPLYGAYQPPARPSEAQRQQQAQVVHDFARQLLAADPQANIVVLGDLNDFQFSTTLATLTGSPAILHPLVNTLPANAQYTYVYDGNSEALDHILLSDNLFANAQYAYDIVHLNAEFADQVSDHDPQVARLTLIAPPTAGAVTVTTDEDTPTTITLAGTASNGGPLTYTVVTSPSHGTLGALNGNQVVYTPNAGYSGSDSFTYKVTENGLDSNIATVSIALAHVNHAPVASDGVATTHQETSVTITLVASDPDGDPLTYTIVSGPAHGTFGPITGNQVTYTPNMGYVGLDNFTFAASDGTTSSNTATVTLTVNGRPIATSATATTTVNKPTTITLNASDPEGAGLTYSIVAGPAHGTLGPITNNQVTYTPAGGYSGPDSFTFKANDGGQDSNVATISITVNGPPIAHDLTIVTDEDTPATIALSATSGASTTFTYTIVGGPAHGTLGVITGGQVVYTPAADYFGPDSFTYRANDGTLDSNIATVTITLTPVNDPPVAIAGVVTIPEDTAVTITLAASDVEGDALTYTIVTRPAHGTLSAINGTQILYTPAPNYYGADLFTFKVNDGQADSNVATITITITPVNDPPFAAAGAATTTQDTPVTIVLTATDPDNTVLIYSIVSGPAHGTLGPITGNHVTYTPAPGYSGADTFTFNASDGELDSNTATITITITPASAVTTVALTIQPPTGNGQVTPGAGVYAYPSGAQAALVATPAAGAIFTGWQVDGRFAGFGNPLVLPLTRDHTVQATFAPRPTFTDVSGGNRDADAIARLAALGVLRGYGDGRAGPGDLVLRAQMAALIARAMGWDSEAHPTGFTDRCDPQGQRCIDDNLWRNIGTLAHYGVARGYTSDLYGPRDSVLQAQVISFITRAMVTQGYWSYQPDDPTLYPNVPANSGHRIDLATFVHYAGAIPDHPGGAAWADWNTPATRAWFAAQLNQALSSRFETLR